MTRRVCECFGGGSVALRELALFAGAGGGILGGKLLGWRTVCAVEIDPFCRRVLLARQLDGCLDRFPIWDDVRTFDGLPWRGGSTWLVGGFRVRTSRYVGGGKVSRGRSPDCGWRWRGSFAKYDPGSSSWRTRQLSLLGGSELYSETWPKWGLMRDGESSARTMPAHLTSGIGSGFWPTPTARDYRSTCASPETHARNSRPLSETVGLWTSRRRNQTSPDGTGGAAPVVLNPEFVETLLGWPIGHTDLEPLVMDRYRAWLRWHGVCSGGHDGS